MKTNWSFYKLTNLTVFAALLKDVPMGCKNAVLPNLCLKITQSTVSRLKRTRDNHITTTCLFRALALHVHGTQRLEEETSKLFNLCINKMDGLSADQFHGVHMNDIPFFEDLLSLNIVLYDVDIVNGNIIGELAGRSVQK